MEEGIPKKGGEKAKKPVKPKATKLPTDKEMKDLILVNLFTVYKNAAASVVKKGGSMSTGKNKGYEQVRPDVTLMNEALERLLELKPELKGEKPVKGKKGKDEAPAEDGEFDLT